MDPKGSERFKAGLDQVLFLSDGSKLVGGFYRGAGNGKRPTAILLHGVPGVEKNLDIAYALREEGWNCLYFHYRGSWGSEGDYSFGGAIDDTLAAIEWVLGQPSVDPHRVALVGNSFGGYLAFAVAAREPRIRAAVSITPLIDPTTLDLPREMFDEFGSMLNGVDGEALQAQWEALPPVSGMSGSLDSQPFLLITADEDEIFPASHYEAFAGERTGLTWSRIAGADHVFNLARPLMIQTVIQWLMNLFGT